MSCLFTHPSQCYALWKEITMCDPHLRSWELSSTSWEQNICINYLEFFCLRYFFSSSPFIYLFNNLFISLLTHGSSILWFIIQYYNIYPVPQIPLSLAIGSIFSWLLCLFNMPSLLWVFFLTLSCFLSHKNTLGSSYVFPFKS